MCGLTERVSCSCLFLRLLKEISGADTSVLRSLVGLAAPVVLGLGHVVPSVGKLHPGAVLVGSSLRVKLGVVLEDSGLLHVSLVVGGLLLVGFGADLLVLRLGEAGRNVGPVGELSGPNILLRAGSVGVLVLLGSKKVHVGDRLEEGLVESGGGLSLGSRGEGRRRGDGGSNEEGGDLHGWFGKVNLTLLDGKWKDYA